MNCSPCSCAYFSGCILHNLADAIVEYADGTWGAFEVKLGIGAVDEAAGSLKTLANKIDTDRVKAPATLTVITGNGFAYRRPDGVLVVPLALLGP